MKTAALLALLIAVALAVAWFIFSKPAYPLTQEDAKKFFLEDLQGKYPLADIREVVEIAAMNSSDGTPYFQLKARVTNGINTPCPERLDVHYDYPPKNFVAQLPEYITRGCKVCLNQPSCVIAFPEEAIIASHTYNGTQEVSDFIKANADAKADTSLVENYGEVSGVWLVNWSSASSASGYRVVLSKSQNKILEVSRTG